MDQSENLFLNNLRERKRKRSDISQALETVKTTSFSDLEDMRNTLDKGDLLSLFKFKVPNALKLANIIREIPTALPKPAKKVLLAYYFSKYSEVRGEFEVERCVRLLNFLTEGLEIHNYEQEAVEILAPPVENCINCNKALVAQNQICSVTVFLRNYVKSAMKFSSCCKDCNLNYGYSKFGNAQNGYKFYEEQRVYIEATDSVFLDRSLCLFQISLA